MKKNFRILQISDIHFRNNQRRNEFKIVCENLYKIIDSTSPRIDRINIVGDLFHIKGAMYPECQYDVEEFILELLKRADVDFLDGNHDMNGNNKNRMPNFFPFYNVIHKIPTKYKLNYLTDSGFIEIEPDLVYGIFSLRQDPSEWPIHIPNKDPNKTYVALHHGTINGCQSENNEVMESDNTIELFKEYDITLLGDIHKRQYLNDEKTIAYAGSFIQQDFGESGSKGFLLWDTVTKESEFVPVYNPYEHLTINVQTIDDVIPLLEHKNITPYTHLRIQITDKVQSTFENDLEIKLLEKYDLKNTPMIISNKNSLQQIKQDYEQNTLNYKDIGYQLAILKQWLIDNGKGDNYVTECSEIHKNCLAQITMPDTVHNRWSLLFLKIDNIGILGEDNKINFVKHPGIIGSFAPNKSGKTTVIEALSFILYGKFFKDLTMQHVLNYTADTGSGVAEILLNNTHYRITRTLKRGKRNGNITSTLILEYKENGEWIADSETSSPKTNAKIASLFGTQEDLKITAITTSKDVEGLINNNQTERLSALYRFANLGFFEDLNVYAKKIVSKLQEESNVLQLGGNTATYQQIQLQQKHLENEIETSKESIEIYETKINDLTEEITKIKSTLVEVPDGIEDKIKTLKYEKESTQFKIKDLKQTIESKTQLLEREEFNISNIKTKAKKLLGDKKSKEVLPLLPLAKESEEILAKTNTNLVQKLKDKNNIERQIEILNKQDWVHTDENCKKCMFLEDAWKSQSKYSLLIDEIETIKLNLHDVTAIVQNIGYSYKELIDIKELMDLLNESKINLEKYEMALESAKEKLPLFESKLRDEMEKLSSLQDTLERIELNASIKDNIRSKERELTILKNELKSKRESIYSTEAEIGRCEGKLKNIEENLEKLVNFEKEIEYYTTYIAATDKKGLPFQIISSLLPQINAEINSILASGDSDNGKVIIKTDDKKLYINFLDKIKGKDDIVRTYERPIEASSGAESTIVSIALRTALTRISAIPKPNFLIFDESFKNVDVNGMPQVKSFLQRLKSNFDFIFVISHDLTFKDFVDHILLVERADYGCSELSI